MEYKEGYIENGELKFRYTKQINQAKLTPNCWLIQFKGIEACNTCDLRNTDECGGGNTLEILKNNAMKIFEHPNTSNNWKCPICNTDEDKPVTLIGIVGTEEGNIMEAEQFHIHCLKTYLKTQIFITIKNRVC